VTLPREAVARWEDLAPMQHLLTRSLLAEHPSAYIHPGDLAWWLGWPRGRMRARGQRRPVGGRRGGLRAWVMLDEDDVGGWVDTDDGRDPEASWTAPGRAAACTIAWPDVTSGVADFEPVATHPAYQWQGYGTAVLREGCRRLAAAGMRRALVRTGIDNAPAIGLYRAVGFEDDHIEPTFRRA
jgi:ribosomal protein S18 acetylase RimI-like enzyme